MQQLVHDIWNEKYRYNNEPDFDATVGRVVDGIYAKDPNYKQKELARRLMEERILVPAGRIWAGAGTDKRVTLINCFISPELQDSMLTESGIPGKGIMDALRDGAISQQMGGGIGTDFTPLRPRGAIVRRTGSIASGPVNFMDMWHGMCGTVRSSGSRRGAMMGTLAIWHPDIREFIRAKREAGRLTNFNVSVLVPDDFMEAVENDGTWDLKFPVPRADGTHIETHEAPSGKTWYVYERVKARDLWEEIIQLTYVYAEPGVIFFDKVNYWNNLVYCEHIHCTNPCGEQPMPPNGSCDLGAINLAMLVANPFSEHPVFNYTKLETAVSVMVRLLDNVLDVTHFPTEENRAEAIAKRRIGLGYTGLANVFQQMGVRYGSTASIQLTSQIGKVVANMAYDVSAHLARERGKFGAYDEKIVSAPFIKKLLPRTRDSILQNGLRNGVLLTIAPTGTTSILMGNVSSGLEPVFAHEYDRNVRNEDGKTFRTYKAYDFGALAWKEHRKAANLGDEYPDWFVTADDLSVNDHLDIQAAAQYWVDASISKTINVPTETPYENFKDIYTRAYRMGLKGCTTYRYDERAGRGEILVSKKKPAPVNKVPMQDILEGRRYRIVWPLISEGAFYITINDYMDEAGQRRPFEIFINTKSPQHDEWIKALAMLITAIFRRGGDIAFVAEELKQVYSLTGGAWINGQRLNSLAGLIGHKIEQHLEWLGLLKPLEAPKPVAQHETCPQCLSVTLLRLEGCKKCASCGYSTC